MDGHFLTKMIDMFHWIHSAFIKGEGGLMKSPRKTCILYTSCEGGPSNLTQRFVHGIVLKAFMGWALILTLMAIFLVARESLTRWSFGSSPIRSIICILGWQLGVRWWCLRCTRRNFFFNSSISRCMSLSFFAWETWLFPCDWLLLVCVICILPSWSPLCWGFATELLCWDPPDSA